MSAAIVDLEIIKSLTEWKPELGLWRFADGDLAIHRAVALGKIEHVKYLCNPVVINEPGANGDTPLHYAVRGKDPKMVKYLLQHGADVDGRQSSRPTPLIEALSGRNYEIVDILLDFKANVEAKDEEDWRPLHYVAAQGHHQLTRRLMDSGCELEPQDDEGDTPLFLACRNNHTEVIQLFFARRIGNVTLQCCAGSTYAHVAAYMGRQDVLARLIQMDTSLVFKTDWAGLDPLCIAALCAEPSNVQLLLANGASPDGPPCAHQTPLGLAAAEGSIKIVDLLLRVGAKVDKTGGPLLRTPLMLAVRSGRTRTAHHLLQAGANPFLRDELVSFLETWAYLCHMVNSI